MNLNDIRAEYLQEELNISDLDNDPIQQLRIWFDQALKSEILYPNAAALATVDKELMPQNRIILIKDIKDDALSFFTDYRSDKGQDLDHNPKACLNLFWKEFDRQVRINGHIEKMSFKESEKYFQSRPKESQISATASLQSSVVDKKELIKKVNELKQRYQDKDILPCPEHWGGYLLRPTRFEFWQGRPSRLHDRFQYTKEDQWNINRLSP